MSSHSAPPSPPLPQLPLRAAESHKGDYGRALLVGGSRGMSGAIALAGMGALRCGAGLVTLALPDVCLGAVAALEPSYMTVPLPSDDQGRIALSAKDAIAGRAETATCLACGPGFGRSDQLGELASWMYESLERPIVFDADALNLLAARPRGLAGGGGPRILTPHAGEFRRLCGRRPCRQDQHAAAMEMAAEHGVIIVLKGHRSLTTDGRRAARNETGNPGMATGGSGDVLTGVITALVCQGLAPFEAAQLGVHIHGLAGDLAAEQLGQTALIASDLVRFLPPAIRRLEGRT
jgi:NAD(P)H-hydrate epimerase